MPVQYTEFQEGKRIRFKHDYFDQASFALEEPAHPALADKGDTGVVTKVSGNLTKITLDKGGFVRIFKSIDGNIEPWERDDSLEFIE